MKKNSKKLSRKAKQKEVKPAFQDCSFSFEDILENENSQRVFGSYLKTEFNHEPLDFIIQVNALQSIESNTKTYSSIVQKTSFISKNFLKRGSPSEVNLSSDTMVQFNKIVDTLKIHEISDKIESNEALSEEEIKAHMEQWDHKTLFKDVYKVVLFQLKFDSFPRFVLSSLFKTYFNNCTLEELNDLASFGDDASECSESTSIGPSKKKTKWKNSKGLKCPITDEQMGNYYLVPDNHIDFIKFLMNDHSNYKVVGWNRKEKVTAFSYNKKIFANSKIPIARKATVQKYSGIMPYSFKDCLDVYNRTDMNEESDPNLLYNDNRRFYPYDELCKMYPEETKNMKTKRSSLVHSAYFKFVFPISTIRETCLCSTFYLDENSKESFLVFKPTSIDFSIDESFDDRHFERPSKFIPMFLYALYHFKEVDKNGTQVTELDITYLGNTLSSKLVKMAQMQRALQFFESFDETMKKNINRVKEMKEKKDDGYARLVDCFLEDNNISLK